MRSVSRASVSFTADRLTVVMPSAGVWPRGSTNIRVSKSMRGRRLAIATLNVVSFIRLRPASPGIPARSMICVVAPDGRPETQIWSPSRVTAAPCTGGSSRTQSSAWKSSRRAGATVKSMHARGGSASGSARTWLTSTPTARRVSSSTWRIALVVRRPLGRRLERLDGLRGPVQRLQRVGHQQQRRHLLGARIDCGEVLPRSLEGMVGVGRCAAHVGHRQRHPLRRRRVAQADPGLQRSGRGRPVLLADRHRCRLFRLAPRLRRAARRIACGQGVGVGVAVGLQTGQFEVGSPRGAATARPSSAASSSAKRRMTLLPSSRFQFTPP